MNATHRTASAELVAKRPAHDLNDKIVVVANPTAKYRVGWTFKALEIKVWAVLNGKVYGHNAEHGECWALASDVAQ